MQEAVLANSLVNERGQRDSHFEKDRRLEQHNLRIKEIKTHRRTSTLSLDNQLRKCALMVPAFRKLSSVFETAYGVTVGGHHAFKPVHEDLLSLALQLSKQSLRSTPGVVSKEMVSSLYYTGVRQLEAKVQAFNRGILDLIVGVDSAETDETDSRENHIDVFTRPVLENDYYSDSSASIQSVG